MHLSRAVDFVCCCGCYLLADVNTTKVNTTNQKTMRFILSKKN